jgi:hypothetical protein
LSLRLFAQLVSLFKSCLSNISCDYTTNFSKIATTVIICVTTLSTLHNNIKNQIMMKMTRTPATCTRSTQVTRPLVAIARAKPLSATTTTTSRAKQTQVTTARSVTQLLAPLKPVRGAPFVQSRDAAMWHANAITKKAAPAPSSNTATHAFAVSLRMPKKNRLSHYEVKTMLQNMWDKFEDENIEGGLQVADKLLPFASEDTVHNYFKIVVQEQSISWDSMSNVYNEIADRLEENQFVGHLRTSSMKKIQEWTLPYLLTPVTLAHLQNQPTSSVASKAVKGASVATSFVEKLKRTGVEVLELQNHVLVPKSSAFKFVDMLEQDRLLVSGVSTWGDDRGVLAEVGYGLDLHDTVEANRNDPNLVRTCANEARDFLSTECQYEEVQWVSVHTNESLTN